MHEHFDAEGVPTGFTRVTVEPRVSEDDRAQILALADYENTRCPCGCGQPIEEASDDKRAFKINTFRCNARRAIEMERRRRRDEAERDDKPEGWDDGLSYFVEDSFEFKPPAPPPQVRPNRRAHPRTRTRAHTRVETGEGSTDG